MSQPEQPPFVPGPPSYYGRPQQPPIGYGWAPQPPRPPRPKSKLDFWRSTPGVFSILVVLGALVLIGSRFLPDPKDDLQVTVISCEFTSGTLPSAKVGLMVKNSSSTVQSAVVHLEYRDDSGNRIDTDTAYVRNIAPGDTVRTDEITLLDASAVSGQCDVVGVD